METAARIRTFPGFAAAAAVSSTVNSNGVSAKLPCEYVEPSQLSSAYKNFDRKSPLVLYY